MKVTPLLFSIAFTACSPNLNGNGGGSPDPAPAVSRAANPIDDTAYLHRDSLGVGHIVADNTQVA